MKRSFISIVAMVLCFSMLFLLLGCTAGTVPNSTESGTGQITQNTQTQIDTSYIQTDTVFGTITDKIIQTQILTEPPTEAVTQAPTSVQTEIVTQAPTSVQTEIVTQASTSVQTEIVTQAPTSVQTEAVTDTQMSTHVQTEPITQVPTYVYTESVTMPSWDTESEEVTLPPLYIEVETVTETQTEAETETQTETATDIQTETVTDIQTETVTDIQTETVTDIQTEIVTETQTETVTETQTETVTETQTEIVTETQTEIVTETQTETVTETQTEVESETQTEVQIDTETEIVTETEKITETEKLTETEKPTQKETAKQEVTFRLRFASYNIFHAEKAGYDVSKIAKIITENAIDVVGFQEVDQNTSRSGRLDTMKKLSEATGYKYYAFFKAIDFQGGQYGVGILSRYPIESTGSIKLTSGDEQRVLGRATIVKNNVRVNFFVTHLSYDGEDGTNSTTRKTQFSQIARELAKYDNFVLAGDFNTRNLNEYDVIKNSALVNGKENPQITYPDGKSPLDNLVYSTNVWTFGNPKIVTNSYSDHYMICSQGIYKSVKNT